MITSPTEAHFAPAPKIVTLGATGLTGRYIVSHGYDATILMRSPEKAADMTEATAVAGRAGSG